MRNRAVFSVAACLGVVACSGGDGDDRGPLAPIFSSVFNSPSPPSVEGEYSIDGSEYYVAAPVAYPDPSTLTIGGHLEGRLRDVQLSGDTTDNVGTLQALPEGSSYLYINAAMAGTPAGAGMIMLNINGGMEHPAFAEGIWSNERELEYQASTNYSTTNLISVGSCAGPALGDYPYEQQAVDYDMTIEEDPAAPGSVVVVVGASFYVDDNWAQTSDLVATLRFARPE